MESNAFKNAGVKFLSVNVGLVGVILTAFYKGTDIFLCTKSLTDDNKGSPSLCRTHPIGL